MSKLLNELNEQPWNSPLQLALGGLLIFLMAIMAGPHYGCGPGNIGSSGVFSCADGAMPALYKFLIISCMVAASLCWGRAVSLLETRATEEED